MKVNDSYKVIIEKDKSDPRWDYFISSLEHSSHYEQSTCWAKVKEHQGWKAIRIKVLKGSEWLAGAQMLYRQLPIGGSVGRISSGPFYKLPNDSSLDILLHSINEVAQELQIQYVAITPYVENAYLDELLENYGFHPTNEVLPPLATVRATLVLDLSKGENELLMDMKPETRRRIRVALKSGLSFREGDRADLDVLFKLMLMVAKKRNEKPVPASVEFFQSVWDHFYPKGYLKLFVVESQGEPVSMGLVFTFGNTVRFWKYGWSEKEGKKQPNRLLYWEMIKWAKNNGFRFLDVVQIDPHIANHFWLGLPVTKELQSRRLYGPTVFKMSFGGKILNFSGPWFRFQNPLIGNFYRFIAPALARMPFAKRSRSTIV